MKRNKEDVYYGDYLALDKLLDAQHPESAKYEGEAAHDETLFIIVHQVYELWFKQILHELKSIHKMMAGESLSDRQLHTINLRLERVKVIQKLLVDQIDVMETMTPLDFLDFRDYLVPASGFQSIQFKQIEIMLGLKRDYRSSKDRECFYSRLTDEHRQCLEAMEDRCPSVFDMMESWLERMPFLDHEKYTFWQEYKQAVDVMLERDREIIESNATVPQDMIAAELKEWKRTKASFNALLDEGSYRAMQESGEVRLSQKAMLAAVFIHLYRDEPILHQPFRFLMNLMEVDELLTNWRTRHAIMVQRMIGSKIGTGGTSGHDYLMQTTKHNRIYLDLYNVTTFLIRRSDLPKLSSDMERELGYYFSGNDV